MKRLLQELLGMAAAAGVTVLLMFLAWEVIEQQYATSDEVAHLMHYARGISSSLVTAAVVGWVAFRQARARAAALEAEIDRRTREADHARAVLQLVNDAAPATFVLVDKDRNVIQANQVAERIHGSGLVGQSCKTAFGGDERCTICPGCGTLDTGQPGVALRELTDPRTGEIVSIESHPVHLPHGDDAALLVGRVITEQKKLQASLLHQEKMAAFGLVAAGVAHEMGNPLSSIEMHLQLLDDSRLSDEDAQSVETLRQEAQRLRRTLRELVDFARKRRDEASLVSVETVVQDALRLIRYDRRMRRVEIEVEASADTPAVHMVEDHLMQVILNLIINALDAMPDGGRVFIDTRAIGNKLVLRVRDTGVGMPRDVLDRCLEPLYTTKAPGKGTGLGLSICKDVLASAGGDLELHSAIGSGTTVIVTLPAAQEDRAESGRARSVEVLH